MKPLLKGIVTLLVTSELIRGVVAVPQVRARLVKRAGGPTPGTSINNHKAGTQPVSFSLTEEDYVKALASLDAQPKLPEPATEPEDRCEYSYKSVLGAHNTTALGELWTLPGLYDLIAEDIKQGAIGDCGMGASVMALVANGLTSYVRKSLLFFPDRPNPGDRSIVISFKKVVWENGKRKVTGELALLNDELPMLTNSNGNCFEYLGYQPVKDAASRAPDGSYPPTNIFFMPLYEKAWAKYRDARSSQDDGHTGYFGLEGTHAEYVLEAFTGGDPIYISRTQPGWDNKLIAATFKCVLQKMPCVIGTPDPVTLDGLGEKSSYNTIHLPGVVVASDSPLNDVTFTLIDYDCGNAVRTLVGTHAYAIDRHNSVIKSQLEESRVTLLNPWGCNPDIVKEHSGFCPYGTHDPRITLSLRAFLGIVMRIRTVDNMENI